MKTRIDQSAHKRAPPEDTDDPAAYMSVSTSQSRQRRAGIALGTEIRSSCDLAMRWNILFKVRISRLGAVSRICTTLNQPTAISGARLRIAIDATAVRQDRICWSRSCSTHSLAWRLIKFSDRAMRIMCSTLYSLDSTIDALSDEHRRWVHLPRSAQPSGDLLGHVSIGLYESKLIGRVPEPRSEWFLAASCTTGDHRYSLEQLINELGSSYACTTTSL